MLIYLLDIEWCLYFWNLFLQIPFERLDVYGLSDWARHCGKRQDRMKDTRATRNWCSKKLERTK